MRVSGTHKFTVGVLIASLAISALSLGTTNSVSAQAPGSQRYVVLGSGGSLPVGLESLVAATGGTVVSRVDEIGMAVIESSEPNFLDAVSALPGVEAAGLDVEVLVAPSAEGLVVEGVDGEGVEGSNPGGATFFFAQWNLRSIAADQAWAMNYTGIPQVKVAVIDTGIDYTHQEFTGRVDMARSKSFINEPRPTGTMPIIDVHGHGSHVAGIVVTNAISIAGVNRYVTLIAIKVAGRNGFASIATIAEAIVYAANQGADVINMSFGDDLTKDELKASHLKQTIMKAINYAHAKGALLVASAGNSGINWDDKDHKKLEKFPVSFPHVVGVSATGPFFGSGYDNLGVALTAGSYIQYTDYGKSIVDFAAPGGSLTLFTLPNGMPADLIFSVCARFSRSSCSSGKAGIFMVGSSMAAAHVTAAAALIDSVFGGALNGEQILAILKNGAQDMGKPGKDEFYGYGRINVYRSVAP